MKMAAILSGSFLIFIAGCSSSVGDNDVSSGGPNPLDEPSTATCQNWLDATLAEQDEASLRFVQALDAVDQSAGFADSFAVDISKDCAVSPEMQLAEVVGALATLDTEDFRH
jgi:hypothetical protein